MIRRIALYESASFDPYYNLAVEQHLLERVEENTCILYLWQNENTVVIGRNQNAWKECRTTLLEQEGGHLARRLSGGGAVFHDLGNLNFTFLVPQAEYDLDRQLSVIQRAALIFGIPAEKSGRNDVLADGRKFSGNAFYRNGTQAYHHGTLLMDVDKARMSRYLNPSKAKLQSKGVDSVRSRVVNLRELCPGLTVEKMADAMIQAFEQVYGLPSTPLRREDFDAAKLEKLRDQFSSRSWVFRPELPFDFACGDKFGWGEIRLQLRIGEGVCLHAEVYTDAMDADLSAVLEHALEGCTFSACDLFRGINGASVPPEVKTDLCGLIAAQNI